MADEFKLRCAIVEYVQGLTADKNNGLDTDSLEVALQCLTESLQVDLSSDAYTKNVIGGSGLLGVFTAGLTGGSVPAAAPVASSAPGTAAHWNSFVGTATGKGLFGDMIIGSAAYQGELKKLSAQYQAQFNLEKAPIGSADISESDKARAEVLKNAGNASLQKGNAKDAFDKYTDAILLDPTNAVYWCNRSFACYKLQKFPQAAADAGQAIKVDSKYVKAYYRLGMAYAAQRLYSDAINAFQYALGIATETGDATLRGDIQRELDAARAKSKTAVGNKKPAGRPQQQQQPDLQQLMSNPNVQAMLQNPDLMKSLGGMLNGDGNEEMDLAALQSVLGGALGSDAPGTENLADIVNQVKDDPAVEALNDDPQMAAIMKEIELNGPAAAMKYLSDPSVMQKIGPLVQKFMAGLKK